jgi:hypothetical protein
VFGALGAAFSREHARKASVQVPTVASIATPVLVSVTPQAQVDRFGRTKPGRRALRLVKSGPEDDQ